MTEETKKLYDSVDVTVEHSGAPEGALEAVTDKLAAARKEQVAETCPNYQAAGTTYEITVTPAEGKKGRASGADYAEAFKKATKDGKVTPQEVSVKAVQTVHLPYQEVTVTGKGKTRDEVLEDLARQEKVLRDNYRNRVGTEPVDAEYKTQLFSGSWLKKNKEQPRGKVVAEGTARTPEAAEESARSGLGNAVTRGALFTGTLAYKVYEALSEAPRRTGGTGAAYAPRAATRTEFF